VLNHIRVFEAFEGFGLSIKSSFTNLSIAREDLSHANCLIFATFLLNLPSIGAVASCERLSIDILILTGVISVSGDGLTSDNSTDQWLNDSEINDESSNGIIVVEDERQ